MEFAIIGAVILIGVIADELMKRYTTRRRAARALLAKQKRRDAGHHGAGELQHGIPADSGMVGWLRLAFLNFAQRAFCAALMPSKPSEKCHPSFSLGAARGLGGRRCCLLTFDLSPARFFERPTIRARPAADMPPFFWS